MVTSPSQALATLEAERCSWLAAFAQSGKAGLVRMGQGLPLVAGRAGGMALVTVLPSKAGLPALLRTLDRKGGRGASDAVEAGRDLPLAVCFTGGSRRTKAVASTVQSAVHVRQEAAAGLGRRQTGGFASGVAARRSARSSAWPASTPERMDRATASSSATCGLVSE